MIDVTPFLDSLDGKPVAVFGLARSGLSTIKALKAAGAIVYAWDDNQVAQDKAKDLGANVQPLADVLGDCACLVLAPGVPLTHPEPHAIVKAARAADVEILCDVEILYRSIKDLTDAPVLVGITGTNGKSTTTALLTHVLNACKLSAVMGGNIGVPALDLDLEALSRSVLRPVIVLELSSYQLDLCPKLALDIAIWLNISPDHLDRHGDMAGYIAAKKRIFNGSRVQIIGVDDAPSQDVFSVIGGLSISQNFSFPDVDNPNLRGKHNAQNMAAVLMAARELECKDEDITAALNSYPGLPHRQFLVREIGGVCYINDSKATNAEAAGKALGAYDDIYWIAGGRQKEGGLAGLEEFVPRVRHAFLIGEAAQDFSSWFEAQGIPYTMCGKLEVAVESAHNVAQGAGSGVVLLSPACASFDQFSSFEARGDEFSELVEAL